jgi:hypothetical protein
MSDKIFADGIYLNKVSEKAPAFIVANVSINIDKAIAWLGTQKANADEKGYIKLTGLESKDGTKRYFTVDTWKPSPTSDVESPF